MAKYEGYVIEHEFGPNEASYFTTCYPHPLDRADVKDKRSKEYTGLPIQVTADLDALCAEDNTGRARYVMNLATYAPYAADDTESTASDDNCLSFMYTWRQRGHQSEWAREPQSRSTDDNPICHPALGRRIESLKAAKSGDLSYVAFGTPYGRTPDCFFLRTTDSAGTWSYRWHGLPERCEMAVQKHVQGGESNREGQNKWVGGRLRAVTFGFENTWIVYRGGFWDWEGPFPDELEKALEEGRGKWTINKAVLNPRNPNEYVLIFNEGDVFFALHRNFMLRLRKVVDEWAKGKGHGFTPTYHPVQLADDHCRHIRPRARAQTAVPPNRSQQSSVDISNGLPSSSDPNLQLRNTASNSVPPGQSNGNSWPTNQGQTQGYPFMQYTAVPPLMGMPQHMHDPALSPSCPICQQLQILAMQQRFTQIGELPAQYYPTPAASVNAESSSREGTLQRLFGRQGRNSRGNPR